MIDPASREPRWLGRWLFGVVLLGVAIRLAFVFLAGDLLLWADEKEYVYLGATQQYFGVYLDSDHWLWPPGYPAYLSLIFGRFGEQGLLAARVGQCLIAAVVGTGVVLLARRLFDDRAALVAGALWAFYLPLVGVTHTLWPETLLLAALVPAIYLYLGVLESPRVGLVTSSRLVAAGLLLGLACLLKEVAVVILMALAPALVLVALPVSRYRRLLWAALLVASAATVILPWGLRNQEVYGRWVPSGATLGRYMWHGVNAVYRNFDYGPIGHRKIIRHSATYRLLVKRSPAEQWGPSQAANVVDRSSENVSRAVDFACHHPSFVARTRIKSLADLMTPFSIFARYFVLGYYPESISRGPVVHLLVFASLAMSALVMAAAVPGLLVSVERPRLMLPFLIVMGCVLASGVINGMSRYRLPMEPLLIVLAAGFLARPRRPPDGRWWATPTVAACWLILLALWGINAVEVGQIVRLALGSAP